MCDLKQFNREQVEFITSNLVNNALIGIPGGGKTRTIIERGKYLKFSNIINNDNEILILMFNKQACEDFINKSDTKMFSSLNVKTVHGLAYSIIKICNIPFNLRTCLIDAFNIIENNRAICLRLLCLKNCKCIIVDEAQDMSKIQYKLIKKICDHLNIFLQLVGDPNQTIYKSLSDPAEEKYLVECKDKIVLVKNYRSTRQIVNFVNGFRPLTNYDSMESMTEYEGKKPFLYINDIESICLHLLNDIKTTEVKYEDICVIGPVKLSKPIMDEYKSMGLSLILNLFENNNIPYVKHYYDGKDNIISNKTIIRIPGHINLITGHSSKGLEFKKLIVLNFQEKTMTAKLSNDTLYQHKFLWYVILSRAKEELTIYCMKQNKLWPGIYNIDKNLYNSNVEVVTKEIKTEDIKTVYFGVTEFISLLNNENYSNLIRELKYTTIKEKFYEEDLPKPLDYNIFSALYGFYAELLYEINYYIKNNTINFYIESEIKKINGVILLDPIRVIIFKNLKQRYNFLSDDFELKSLELIDIEELDAKEKGFINFIKNKKKNLIRIRYENSVVEYDKDKIINYYRQLLTNKYYYIFMISLYKYQFNYESKFLLLKDWNEHISSLYLYSNLIDNLNYEEKFDFQVNLIKEKLSGIADIIGNNKVIELKFTNTFSTDYILQALLYHLMVFPNKDLINIEIINLLLGIRYYINFTSIGNFEEKVRNILILE